MKLNSMSSADVDRLKVGDWIYDLNNRKVMIVDKNENTFLVEKYMTENGSIILHKRLAPWELERNYTTHIKEDNYGTSRNSNDKIS